VGVVPSQTRPAQLPSATGSAVNMIGDSSDESLPNSWEGIVQGLKPVEFLLPTTKLPTKNVKKRKAVEPVQNKIQVKKRGRQPGAKQWCEAETTHLLDHIEAVLPVGPKGWGEVTKRFNVSAKSQDMPERAQRSLELRFKKVRISTYL
jgi:hypothetical protein